MAKLILALVLFTCLWADKHPKEIIGKWVVESVDIPAEVTAKAQGNQNAMMMLVMMQQMFQNATFDFKADHHASTSVNLPQMPKSNYWEYDPAHGELILSESKDNPRALHITVTEVNGKTIFTMEKVHVILKMHKG